MASTNTGLYSVTGLGVMFCDCGMAFQYGSIMNGQSETATTRQSHDMIC